jgi:uncharacterized membrane protein
MKCGFWVRKKKTRSKARRLEWAQVNEKEEAEKKKINKIKSNQKITRTLVVVCLCFAFSCVSNPPASEELALD